MSINLSKAELFINQFLDKSPKSKQKPTVLDFVNYFENN